jgi:hypothetical protein
MFHIRLAGCFIRTQGRSVFEPISKPNHVAVRVLCKVLGTLSTICMKSVSLFHSYVNEMLSMCFNII